MSRLARCEESACSALFVDTTDGQATREQGWYESDLDLEVERAPSHKGIIHLYVPEDFCVISLDAGAP